MTRRLIWCCACQKDVQAKLIDALEIYNHRKDLAGIPRWKCETCGNHVGCHHKTSDPTRPLGNIPDKAMRYARVCIHAELDPIWKSGHMTRSQIYAELSRKLGYSYHTAEIKTIEEARAIFRLVRAIASRYR